MTYNQEKDKSIETDAELTETQNLADKDVKRDTINMLNMLKKVENHMEVLRDKWKIFLRPKWKSRNEK